MRSLFGLGRVFGAFQAGLEPTQGGFGLGARAQAG